MIRIGICDDFQVMREEFKKCLFKYGERRRIEYCIYEYDNGSKMLEDNREYDLVFMDYEFKNDKENNGLTIATKLRERQKNITIVFLSSYPEIVFDTFSVGTFRFLVKPIQMDKFEKAMDDYLKSLKGDNILTIKIEGVKRSIHTNEITYVEGFGKYCIIHMASEKESEIECHETLAAVEERLPKEFFYRCHKSYVIDFPYIESYNHMSVMLNSGEELAISRQKYKEFCNVYLEYLNRYC